MKYLKTMWKYYFYAKQNGRSLREESYFLHCTKLVQ